MPKPKFPDALVNVTAIPSRGTIGPLVYWSPKTCSQCLSCRWDSVVKSGVQLPHCTNTSSPAFKQRNGFLEPDMKACPEFKDRPSTLQIVSGRRTDLLRIAIAVGTDEKMQKAQKSFDDIVRLLFAILCGCDILIRLFQILFLQK